MLREPLLNMEMSSIVDYALTAGGTGYVDGFYPNVRLGGGSGTGAQANITVLGGTVTDVVLVNSGTNYAVNNVLNISAAQVGGSGSGCQVTVTFVGGNLDTPIDFPPGYERFFRLNLAVEIAAEFGKKLRDETIAMAQAAKLELETLNSTPVYLRGDGGLQGRNTHGRYFNYITGNFLPYWSN